MRTRREGDSKRLGGLVTYEGFLTALGFLELKMTESGVLIIKDL